MTKISALPQDTSPTTDDYAVSLDSGSTTTKKAKWADIITMIFANLPATFSGGWQSINATLTYTSWDSTNLTGVVGTSVDLTGQIGVKDRLQWSQPTGGTKWAIVVAITSTSITFRMPSSSSLTNETISSPLYSHQDNPYGFISDPTRWTIILSDTVERSFNVTSYGAITSLSLAFGMGAWNIVNEYLIRSDATTTSYVQCFVALSTSTSAVSNPNLQAGSIATSPSASATRHGTYCSVNDYVVLGSATTYYMIGKQNSTSGYTCYIEGAIAQTMIKGLFAYL